MNTEQIMAPLKDVAELAARLRVGVTHDTRDDLEAFSCYNLEMAAEEAADALEALVQERDAAITRNKEHEQFRHQHRDCSMLAVERNTHQREADMLAEENKMLRDALEQALPYMEAESVINGYGYYRPENPHNFHPDHEVCSESEIANHKAACAAYDAGTYRDDYGDGWLSPSLHVTKAPWGIGSYIEPIPEIEAQCKQARAALTRKQS